MPKYEIHQRAVALVSEFNKVWEFLNTKGELSLMTEKNRRPFIAKASVVKRGKHLGEGVILFLNEDTRRVSAYVFKCCWGYHTNCYGEGTRIGMYCEALDNYVTSL